MSHDQWDKGFPHLSRPENIGALNITHLCRINALTVTWSVPLVSRSAAEYQQSQFQNGEFVDTWVDGHTGNTKSWEQVSIPYYYEAWDTQVGKHAYPFQHEPIMITLEDLNNEPRSTNIFDGADVAKWKEHSLEPLSCLTAHYFEKFPVVVRLDEPLSKQKQPRGAINPLPVPDSSVPPTDAAFKGVFGRLMTAINQGTLTGFDKWDHYFQKAIQFVTIGENNADFVRKGTAFAPFKIFVLTHSDKAPAGWLDKLDASVKKKTGHSTAASWVGSFAKTARGGKGGGKKKTGKGKEKGKGGGKVGGRSKRKRTEQLFDESRLVDDDDCASEEDQEYEPEESDEGEVSGAEDSPKKTAVSLEEFQALALAVTNVSDKQHRLSRKHVELENKVDELPSAPTESAEVSAELASMRAHNKEMVALMAQLGTVVNILAPKRNNASGTSDSMEQMRIMASEALFNGIVNQVVNVYNWDDDKKRSFYSSLKGIDVFDTALQELGGATPK